MNKNNNIKNSDWADNVLIRIAIFSLIWIGCYHVLHYWCKPWRIDVFIAFIITIGGCFSKSFKNWLLMRDDT